MVSKYLATHPVLTLKERAVITILLCELTVEEVDRSDELYLSTGMNIEDLSIMAGETRQTMSNLLKCLEKFELVKVGDGEGRKNNKTIYMSIKGPWPMLGDHPHKELKWRGGFIMLLGGMSLKQTTQTWRKAVLNGYVTDPSSQMLAFLQSGGKTVDPDIEDMRPLFNKKAQPKPVKDTPKVSEVPVTVELHVDSLTS